MEDTAVELYRRYRPKLFKEVLGQPEAVKALEEMVKNNRVPHALLFSGESGVGKTTLARILKKKLGCSDHDFVEINAADSRGIEMVREIRERMNLAPFHDSSCRIWYVDECHAATGAAQDCLLKPLEDVPDHVYFMLATTRPDKLVNTIRTRCTQIVLKPLSLKALETIVASVLEKEKLTLSLEVLNKLIEVAEGSGRKALVLLHQIRGLEEKEQLEILESSDTRKAATSIAQALLNPRIHWPEVAKLLKDNEEDPEGVRRQVLGYARAVLLSGGKMASRAFLIITCFEGNFFDSGAPGLARACYEVLVGSKQEK